MEGKIEIETTRGNMVRVSWEDNSESIYDSWKDAVEAIDRDKEKKEDMDDWDALVVSKRKSNKNQNSEKGSDIVSMEYIMKMADEGKTIQDLIKLIEDRK